MYNMSRYAETVAEQDAVRGMEGLNAKLEELKDRSLQNALFLSNNPEVIQAVASKESARLFKVLESIIQDTKLDFVTVTDKNGIVLARTHESRKTGDNVSNQYNIQMALKNQPVATIEQGTMIKLAVRAGVPVKNDQGNIIGIISTGYSLDKPELLDEMKKIFHTDLTLFLGDTRFNTTIFKEGKRMVGTQLDPVIASKVLNKKERYIGSANILGIPYITAYMPMLGSNKEPIGVVFAGQSILEAYKLKNRMTVIVVILTIVLIMLAIFFIALYLKKSIINPIKNLVVYANQLALGDTDIQIKDTSKDEIGTLLSAFQAMAANIKDLSGVAQKIALGDLQVNVKERSEKDILSKSMRQVVETLQDLISETTLLTEAATQGNLGTRGNVSKFEGGYRQVVNGINLTLDAVMEPLNLAADYINKMANGEDLEVIDNRFKGDFYILINNLNSVRTSLYALLEESTILANAATAGQLHVRGDLSRLKGGYSDIVKGINETLDAIIKPLDEAGQVLSRMAVNDYTMEMTGNYQGLLKEFADQINMVQSRLLNVLDVAVKVSKGDTSRLEEFKKIGRRSENDQLVPAFIAMMQSIQDMIDEVKRLSIAGVDGDLKARGNADKFEGGYRAVIIGLNQTLDAINEPLNEALSVLQELANGNLDTEMTGNYRGDHAILKEAINKAINAFNEVLGEIHNAAEQVAAGSRQVSESSQALSQGASEQASTVEEITASVTQIATQTKQNAANAGQANELAMIAKAKAVEGNSQMQEMLKAMIEINDSSSNISKIIKVIDEIAFQTNILALNAAVEAARAGQHGKGFAVVAEEVRNLAARSANAAKETTAMIEGSIKKVENGTKIANDTATALNQIVDGVSKTSDLVSEIAIASNEQATGIIQINQGISQVSQVTQSNTATSEETAAASQELSSQALLLKELVSRFKIKSSDSNTSLMKKSLEHSEDVATSSKRVKKSKIHLDDLEFSKY